MSNWQDLVVLVAGDPVDVDSYLNQNRLNVNHLRNPPGGFCDVVGAGAVWGAFAAGAWASIDAVNYQVSITPSSAYAIVQGQLPIYASVANTKFYLSLNVNGTIISTALKGIGQWDATYGTQANAQMISWWYHLTNLTPEAVNTIIPVIKPLVNTISVDVVNQHATLMVKEFGGS